MCNVNLNNQYFKMHEYDPETKQSRLVCHGSEETAKDLMRYINQRVGDIESEMELPRFITLPFYEYYLLDMYFGYVRQTDPTYYESPEDWAKQLFNMELVHHALITQIGVF